MSIFNIVSKRFLLIFFMLYSFAVKAQSDSLKIDSLKKVLLTQQEDTNKVNTLIEVSRTFGNDSFTKPANMLSMEVLDLSNKIIYPHGQAYSLKAIGIADYIAGQYVDAAAYWNKAYKIFEKIGDKAGEANMLSNLGALYENWGGDPSEYYPKALQLAEEIHDTSRILTVLINLGSNYIQDPEKKDIGLKYYLRAIKILEYSSFMDSGGLFNCCINVGEFYRDDFQFDSSIYFFQQASLDIQHLKVCLIC